MSIAQAVFETLGLREDLEGEVVLVTAGPTEEPLDAVRYISNRSSGKMGYALAEAARRRGARVMLVSGPTHAGTARCRHASSGCGPPRRWRKPCSATPIAATVIVMAAAVADFRPANPQAGKIKKAARRARREA